MDQRNIILSALIGILFINVCNLSAQDINAKDQKAFDILNKAFGGIGEAKSYGIYFEGITYDVQKPSDIFSQPVYKVFRGGHLFANEKKFEIEVGKMKALCDGKLMVMINEEEKSMLIDSLRERSEKEMEGIDMIKILGEDFSNNGLSYEGIEKVNLKECHKIKAVFPNMPDYYVYYYVETASGKLYLMAEWQEKSYDVYWIQKIAKAPIGYDYNVNIPKNEIETLYGYQVFDLRFVSQDIVNISK